MLAGTTANPLIMLYSHLAFADKTALTISISLATFSVAEVATKYTLSFGAEVTRI